MTSSQGKAPRLPVQQLLILSICRFAEPVALSSVFPYLPEMIESFNVPANDVAQWAGITSAVFSFSQCLTGIAWGRASDYFGRKLSILCGLTCTMTACLLFGFSRSLTWAILARSLAGASSGTVGVIRTTVAEMVPERELQPKAFSIMPLVWSIGSIAGPILGGTLANPAVNYPEIFGGLSFFKAFPFALPNLVASLFFVVGITSGFLFLKETLETRKNDRDYGRVVGQSMVRCVTSRHRQRSRRGKYQDGHECLQDTSKRKVSSKPPGYKEVFSYQSSLNLFAYTFLALHSVAYDQIIAVFLHSRLEDNHMYSSSSPLKFAGGFGLSTNRIGMLFTAYGIVMMFLQFLVFPPVARKYGVLNCMRVVTFVYPFVYLATPFAVLLPTSNSRQIVIFCILLCKSIATVFSFPCITILLTNSAGSLRLLGTLNGVSTSISAAGRGIGPFTIGNLFTWGMKIGYVVIPWWALAIFAIIGHIPTWWIVEMEGFGGKAVEKRNNDKNEEHSEEETEILLSRIHSGTASGNNITGETESSELVQRTATFATIPEDQESEDEETIDANRPLLSSGGISSRTQPVSSSLLKVPSHSPPRRPDSAGPKELIIVNDVAQKGRSLSPGAGASGAGSSGFNPATGYDRSRSVSRRRDTSRSKSRERSHETSDPI